MASKSNNVKKRHWGFIVYPDSAPENWREILTETGLPVAISPLHDKDVNEDGTPKKAHWHCIASYSGPTTFNTVNALMSKLNAPIPKGLESVRGNYRYFTHQDNPEKYQYEEKEIQTLNGFDISDFIELSRSEIHSIVIRLEKLIIEHDFDEYSDVCEFLVQSDLMTEHEIFTTRTIHFNALLASRRHRKFKGSPEVDENGVVK